MRGPDEYQDADAPPADDGMPDDPFAPAGGQGVAPGEGKAFNYMGLRNSDPPISPYDVGHELALDVEWWQHLFAGFIKQSNSSGTEAWMHYVVAAILLADSELNLMDAEDREEMTEDAANIMDGPAEPAEDNGTDR
jgi:hypothetical protein